MTAARRNHPPAAEAQIAAARPEASVWVSANAGSGKTRVLTTRVARLLLAGADPQRILCLTYTKAAAAEMQTRLFKTLGGWAMAEDEALRDALDGVLGADEPPVADDQLAEARRLFARALETPGGLKIQTIHAFCESLLSRFPLEAGVSPHFEVADDVASLELAFDARDQVMLDRAEDPALAEAVATVLANAGGGLDELTRDILGMRGAYDAAGDRAALAKLLGVAAEADLARLRADWVRGLDRGGLDALGAFLIATAKEKLERPGRALRAAASAETPEETLRALDAALLTTQGEVRSSRGFPAKADMADAPWVAPRVEALLRAYGDLRADLAAAETLARSDALRVFAAALIRRYQEAKAARALLDYDDLIGRAVGLLTRSEAREWVRYKLDGGVAHILVDEAQDTSPEQWRAVEALAEEFFAGEGAARPSRGPAPTVFAVGDEKQSIYSFQGAAPELLSEMGARFAASAEAADRPFDRSGLATSFRSAPAILAFVDRVFAPAAARRGLVFADEAVRHLAHRSGQPGVVELWPLLLRDGPGEAPPWDAPIDAPAADNPRAALADLVAETISGWIGRERLPARGRTIRPGDVLVLVRRRGALSTGVIKGLKSRGTPVSGADRLSLAKEIAAKDLVALAEICLFPENDLALATILRSPFCDVDEEALFDLAHNRAGRRRLYYELQDRRDERPEFDHAYRFLSELVARADYRRPYELFALALGPLGGRKRMIARLGPEAEDPIDELLAEALRFESAGRPTLQSFALRLAAQEGSIKREHEQGRDEVRVMTAHGAKGLEAPVVVLPDATDAPGVGGRARLLDPAKHRDTDAAPIWLGPKAADPEAVAELRAAAQEREAEEHRRLLYVALTRAEDRLLICGAPSRARDAHAESWYALAAAALRDEAGAPRGDWPNAAVEEFETPIKSPAGAPLRGLRLSGIGDPAAEAPPAGRAETRIAAPAWLARAAPKETLPPDVAPSDLGGEDPEPLSRRRGGSGLGREAAARRGEIIHLALEKCAGLSGDALRDAAAAVVRRSGAGFDDWALAEMAEEAVGVLEDPAFADLFGPASRAEADLTAVSPELGPGEIHGRIDRIALLPDRILIVDFKTGARPDAPPDGYLRQLGVYAKALGTLYPERRVEAALLWTSERRLEHISETALTDAFERAAAELDRRWRAA